jgi:hypothetical protein
LVEVEVHAQVLQELSDRILVRVRFLVTEDSI